MVSWLVRVCSYVDRHESVIICIHICIKRKKDGTDLVDDARALVLAVALLELREGGEHLRPHKR